MLPLRAWSRRGNVSIRLTILVALTFLPLLLWLGWMAATFSGLNSAEALDYAQLARHLARGDGFITSAIPPLSLAFVPRLEAHPSLFHPPLFPLWEALLFRLGGARPAMAALASGTAWLLTLWLVYAFAVRLFDRRAAFFAVVLFAVNLMALRFSVSGLPNLLTAVLLTAVLWTLAGPRTEEEAAPAEDFLAWPPVVWLVLSAVLVGLTVLSDYSLAWSVAVPVSLFWILLSRQWADSASAQPPRMFSRWTTRLVRWLRTNVPLQVGAVLGIVLLLTVSPWLVRNVRVVGHPCFSLTRYDPLTQTPSYPGQSVYRRFTDSLLQPWEFAAEHPLQVARKGLQGLGRVGPEVASLANWVVLALFLAGCLRPPEGDAGRVQRYFLIMLLLQAALLCFTSQRFDRLLAFVPGMTVWAAGTVYRLFGLWAPSDDPGRARFSLRRGRRQALALGAVWVLGALPLVASRVNPSAPPPLAPSANVAYLVEKTPPGRAVMTDAPWLLTWYGDRPAVWLAQEEQELDLLERKVGTLSWLYFSGYGGLMQQDERAGWWARAAVAGHGMFLPHLSQAPGEVVLKRYTRLEGLAEEFPDDPVVHEGAGRALKAQGRLGEALIEFTQAQHLRPQWLDPYLDAGDTCLRLRDYDRAARYFRQALQQSPRSSAARAGLAEVFLAQGKQDQAIQVYEKMLADDPNHPTALNNLACLYAQRGQNLDQALDLAQRAAKIYPQSGWVRYTLGWVCHRAGRSKEAVVHLREAVRLAPEWGLCHYHLGQALWATGRRKEAADAFRTALSLDLPPAERREAEKKRAAIDE